MATKKFAFIVAANVTSVFIYDAIHEAHRLLQVEDAVQSDVKTPVKIEVKDPEDVLFSMFAGGKAGQVFIVVNLMKPVLAPGLTAALQKAFNRVDGAVLKAPITVTLVKQGFFTSKLSQGNGAASANGNHGNGSVVGAPMLDTFGVTMQNLNTSAGAMYAHLFKGFESDPPAAQHVAGRIADYPLVGPTARASTEWSIQYAMCCGQLNDEAQSFQLTDYTECDLGDAGSISKGSGGNVTLTVQGQGSPGTITITVPSGFDNGWYIGFGIVVNGSMHPTGIVNAVDGVVTTFTPKNEYSVNFANNEVDMGVYSKEQYTLMGHFDFTGTSDHYAFCQFLANGTWNITTSSTPPLTDSGRGQQQQQQTSLISLPSDRIKSLHVEYYPPY